MPVAPDIVIRNRDQRGRTGSGNTMKFGVSCGFINELGYISHAENLGFDYRVVSRHASDPLEHLGDDGGRRDADPARSGSGRGSPFRACGWRRSRPTESPRSIRLAPGRVFFGTGTGNTAMRTMGQAPTRIKDFGEYLRVVRGPAAWRGGRVYAERRDAPDPLPESSTRATSTSRTRSRSWSAASVRARRGWRANTATG